MWASSARKRSGRSRVPAPLVAYLAMYAATARSVSAEEPWKSAPRMVRTSSWRPKAKVWARPSRLGPVTRAVAAAARMASVSRSAVAQPGGAALPPSGPSRRMTTWKWTAPRRWYSATLANETRACRRKGRCVSPSGYRGT
jgi:hypothetical protein